MHEIDLLLSVQEVSEFSGSAPLPWNWRSGAGIQRLEQSMSSHRISNRAQPQDIFNCVKLGVNFVMHFLEKLPNFKVVLGLNTCYVLEGPRSFYESAI